MRDETELQILDFFHHSTTLIALKSLDLWFDSETLQK